MSDRSHTVDRLAEDEQDVVGQAVAVVLEQGPDHLGRQPDRRMVAAIDDAHFSRREVGQDDDKN
jgi:hypothetical protein